MSLGVEVKNSTFYEEESPYLFYKGKSKFVQIIRGGHILTLKKMSNVFVY